MPHSFPLLVPGARAAGRLAVAAPFDGSPIAEVETADAAGVECALSTAHALWRDRDAWLPPARRIEILGRVAERMEAIREELALEAAREGGKPLVDSLVEVDRAVDGIRGCIETLRTRAGREIPMGLNAASLGRFAFTRHEPIGVVLAFSAFNHPINLIVHQVGPAVAAGCPVIVKPAEDTPLSCWRVVRLFHEAGLPEEWCQALLATDREVAGKLVSDPRVGFFTFIGSGRVGWMLRAKLAAGTRCALEHGGAAPVIFAVDAEVEEAVPLLTKGGMYHAGQVCVSVQRVFADRRVAQDLAERISAASEALAVDDPTHEATEVGPLIRPGEVARVGEWVEEAVAGGGRLLCGGKPLSERCYAPSVLLDPPPDARVGTQEVFGPVICVYPVDDLDEGVARANALPLAFQAAVFTKDLDTALRMSQRLDAAAVMVNDHTAFRVDWMPFAGFRESGYGTGGIPYTMADMQVEKMTVIHSKEL